MPIPTSVFEKFRKSTKCPILNRMEMQGKELGWTGFSSGWQGCFSVLPLSFALGNSLGGALPAL